MVETRSSDSPRVELAGICDRGLERDENQDSILQVRVPLGDLLIVADGVGGYKGGAVASKMVVESYERSLKAVPKGYSIEQALREATEFTNTAILNAAREPDSPYRRMGSTVVLALLEETQDGINAWIGHVGDSRAYQTTRDGRLLRITNDHSAVQMLLNQNLITPEEAANHPDASVLTRSLGHQPQVEIDVDMVQLEPGDRLLLCSDGLWGYAPHEEIQRIMTDSSLGLQDVASRLLQLALSVGGKDNVGIELALSIA